MLTNETLTKIRLRQYTIDQLNYLLHDCEMQIKECKALRLYETATALHEVKALAENRLRRKLKNILLN